MHKMIVSFNGTKSQARDLVESIKRIQKEKEEKMARKEKLASFFARGESMRQAREIVLFNN